jgi:hypothetical protein
MHVRAGGAVQSDVCADALRLHDPLLEARDGHPAVLGRAVLEGLRDRQDLLLREPGGVVDLKTVQRYCGARFQEALFDSSAVPQPPRNSFWIRRSPWAEPRRAGGGVEGGVTGNKRRGALDGSCRFRLIFLPSSEL